MADVPPAALDGVRARARRVLTIAGDRYVMELPPDGRPETCCASSPRGATMVSLNPLRETLEDVFVRRVAEVGEGARHRERRPLRRRRRVPRVGARSRASTTSCCSPCCSSARRSSSASSRPARTSRSSRTSGSRRRRSSACSSPSSSASAWCRRRSIGAASIRSREADPPLGVHRREVRRAAADAAREHGRDDARAVWRALLPGARRADAIQAAWDAPA